MTGTRATVRRAVGGVALDGVETDNPYWQAIARCHVEGLYGNDDHSVCGWAHGDMCGQGPHPDRCALTRNYAFAIPSPHDLRWFTGQLNGTDVVEIGAGRGYWAYQLHQLGVDVAAYDKNPPHRRFNGYFCATGEDFVNVFHDVRFGNENVVARHHDRAVFLCWPDYNEPHAANVLRLMRPGQLLVYCGEGPYGCTADDDFFELLDRDFEAVAESPDHWHYGTVHDYLASYRKRRDGERGGS